MSLRPNTGLSGRNITTFTDLAAASYEPMPDPAGWTTLTADDLGLPVEIGDPRQGVQQRVMTLAPGLQPHRQDQGRLAALCRGPGGRRETGLCDADPVRGHAVVILQQPGDMRAGDHDMPGQRKVFGLARRHPACL